MRELGIDPEWWGPVHESNTVVGELRQGPDALLGTPVVAGAGDQAASAVGTGLGDGDLGISLGTSGVLFWSLPEFRPAPHPSLHVFCHAWPGTWHWMAVTQSAAASLRWYRDTFYPGQSFADVDREAMEVPAGSEDVLFLPYLDGERAPIMQPGARGAFLGLTGRHGRAHLARAVLEGVAYSLRHCLDSMTADSGVAPRRMILTGGGAKSTLWTQILADVMGAEIVVADDPGAAVGAAWLARDGVGGTHESYPLKSDRTVAPGPDSARYHEGYQDFRRTVDALIAGVWGSENT
jgi:xylulokinase